MHYFTVRNKVSGVGILLKFKIHILFILMCTVRDSELNFLLQMALKKNFFLIYPKILALSQGVLCVIY
jgi:hypothetical protein